MRRTLLSERGQALLEVALVTPMLLAILIGGIEIGRFAYIGILVGNAARAGAAYGSADLSNSVNTGGIQTAADDDFQNNGQSTSDLAVASSISCGCDNGGTVGGLTSSCSTKSNGNASVCGAGHWVVMVSVTASGTFKPLFNYPGISKQFSFSRTSEMRVAQQ